MCNEFDDILPGLATFINTKDNENKTIDDILEQCDVLCEAGVQRLERAKKRGEAPASISMAMDTIHEPTTMARVTEKAMATVLEKVKAMEKVLVKARAMARAKVIAKALARVPARARALARASALESTKVAAQVQATVQVTAATAKVLVRVMAITAVMGTSTQTPGIGGAILGISTPPFRVTGRNGQRMNGRNGQRSKVTLCLTMALTQAKRFAWPRKHQQQQCKPSAPKKTGLKLVTGLGTSNMAKMESGPWTTRTTGSRGTGVSSRAPPRSF